MWVLNCGGFFPCGVFESKEKAEEIINKYKLEGTLTEYPINELAYDWAIENKYFIPKSDKQKTSEFIGKFTTAYQDHYHY
jgi:hypothetical protein